MAPHIDIKKVVADVEKFYLSQNPNTYLPIFINSPINDTLYIHLKKPSSFKEIIYYVLSRINLYLSNILKVYETNNKVGGYSIANSVYSRKNAINLIYNRNLSKYKFTYNITDAGVDVL